MPVIWLNGTVGSGKSTVGRALAARLPGARFLDGDDFATVGPAPERWRAAITALLRQVRRLGGKQVLVIGGGDTGSDCIGTSIRQGAVKVTQIEILPQPPAKENKGMTWPLWPNKFRTSSSQEEGCDREFCVTAKAFEGEDGQLKQVRCIRVEWKNQDGRWVMNEIAESEFIIKADLAFLAMGFLHPTQEGMLKEIGLELDDRGNVKADTQNYQTSLAKVFSAGDMRRGQSLVVWAIREGRQAARAVDEFLMGSSELPR